MEQKEAKEERGDAGREEGGGEGREREPHLPAGLPDPRHPPPQTSSRSVHTMRPGALWDCALCRHHCSLQFLRQWAGRGSFPIKPQQRAQRAGWGSFPNSAHSGQDGAHSPTVHRAGRTGLLPQLCPQRAGRGSSPNSAHSGQDGAPPPTVPTAGRKRLLPNSVHSGQDGALSPTVHTAGRTGLLPQLCPQWAGQGSFPTVPTAGRMGLLPTSTSTVRTAQR